MTWCPSCGESVSEDASFCPTDGTPLDPLIGRTVAGDIVLTSLVGAGAMGRVYRGHQRGVARDVAVKVLRAELAKNRPIVERFEREAKIASKVRHPNVVEVYLTGKTEEGEPYIVMEYVNGVSLREALDATGGTLEVGRAVSIALQISEACAEAHARGVVHRDLKPDNVALLPRADGSDGVKVLDFGIAKTTLGEQTAATAAGAVFGTARYISPEGARGGAVCPASDVYSLAIVLYEMLVGRTPFEGDCGLGMLVKQAHETPADVRTVVAGRCVPDGVAAVIMANLAKDPAARAANAGAFGAALAAAAREDGIVFQEAGGRTSSPASQPRAVSIEPELPADAAPIERVLPPPRRWSARMSVVVGLTFLLGAASAGSVQMVLPTHEGVASGAPRVAAPAPSAPIAAAPIARPSSDVSLLEVRRGSTACSRQAARANKPAH